MNSRSRRVTRHGMYPRASGAVPVRCSVHSAGEQPDHPVTPIDPVYGFGEAGAPITLYRGPLVIGSGKPAEGHIWLRLSGDLEVLWEADKHCALGPTTLEFSCPGIGEVTIPAVVTSSNGFGYLPGAETRAADDLTRVAIHWVNVPMLLPAEPLTNAGKVYAGRWKCETGGWRIVLDMRPDHGACTQGLRHSPNFAMTHVGSLERADGSPFTSAQAVDVLLGLQAALSFAFGGWVAPALPVGFNAEGTRTWEHWAPWRCDPFYGHMHWLDTYRSGDLVAVVTGFLTLWSEPSGRDLIWRLSHHAVCANNGATTTEARIMLAQAALEYLGWVTYVLEQRRPPRRREAHDVLRELLNDAGIPTAIPAELNALRQVLDEPGLDGPRALTWLRNRLVHPKDAAEPYRIENAVQHGWLLSMQYLDLLTLRRVRYNGHYLRRVSGGFAHDSQPVPWAEATAE